jgi:hypothetical protein
VTVSHERAAMLVVVGLAGLGCLLGPTFPPSPEGGNSVSSEALDLLRVLTTAALSATLLLGPGILWLAHRRGGKPGLAFLPLPGFALLAATGVAAWALSSVVEPRLTCLIVVLPVLGLLLGGLISAGDEDLLEPEERRVLLVVGCVLGLAIARSLWSVGPEGELYGNTISRTLEVGDRSDSRISFHVIQLIAHGAGPYGSLADSYLAPYNFSSRGPLSALASAPMAFVSGGDPPAQMPESPWAPFDGQGFMAYRLAMMTLACMAFLAAWQLTRQLAGAAAARFALLLAATTPFLVHEVWFTWPKMLAAAFVLLAALMLVRGRPLQAGLLLGVGYLCHPAALLGLAPLGLIALWPLVGQQWRRPRLRFAVLLVAGLAVAIVGWRLVNGSHYAQSVFFDYLTGTGFNLDPTLGEWVAYRAASIGNTLVPMMLPLFFGHEVAVNAVGADSPPVVHFFFQYWNGIPFGVAIVFLPLLLISLWHAWRRWRWAVFVSVVVPFLAFAVYWGSSPTGMLREGLQAWVLVLFVVVACEQAARGFPWMRSKPIRALLALRVVEVFAVALVPTLATEHVLIENSFRLVDSVALLGMLGFSACLAALVWTQQPPVPEGRTEIGARSNGTESQRLGTLRGDA